MQQPYRLRLMDTYRNLFYTPIYTAVAGGFLYAEGLDVMFGTVPADRPPLDMLRQGEVDIIQTGISRSLMALDDGDEDAPLHIAEINQRDGFFLVSRTPTDNWQWSDLEGATLIPIGFTPVPLTSLTAALRKHSVDIDSITMLKRPISRGRPRSIPPRRRRLHPHAQPAGAGAHRRRRRLPRRIARQRARLPMLQLIRRHTRIHREQPEVVERFVRGFYKAQQWLAATAPEIVAERVKPFFPGVSDSVLQASIARYKSLEIWPDTPDIGTDGYDAMRQVLIDGGLVRDATPTSASSAPSSHSRR